MSEVTDAEAIASSLNDPEVFGVIFERHFDAIYRYLEFRVGHSIADDLAAEVFLIAFDRRSSFQEGRPSAGPWLYGIATRLAHRYYRSQHRRLMAHLRGPRPEHEYDESEIIRRVDADAMKPAIAAAIAALNRRDRDVLLLFAVAGQSYDEIAEALGIPGGTVRSRLHRARRRVRHQLGQRVDAAFTPGRRWTEMEGVTDG